MTPARPMRVLYLDHTAQPGGAELALLRLLTALDRGKVTPLVLLAERGLLEEQLRRAGIETHVLPLDPAVREVRKDTLNLSGSLRKLRTVHKLWAYAREVARFAVDHRIDLIYSNSLKADIYGTLAARRAALPLIWHVHDRIDSRYLPRFAVFALRSLARWAPDRIVANSQSTLAALRLGAGGRAQVISCGLTREYLEECWSPERHNAVPRVGMIGRLAPWKGQDVFIRAAAEVLRRGVRAQFVIVGSALFAEDAYERELRGLVDELGLSDSVQFLGFREVPPLLRSLDVLVHASRIPEPFGQVIIEGLAAELPVIATEGGGASEIIESGRNGLLVPGGDPGALARMLVAVLAEPGRARALAAAGRRDVLERYTAERSARHSEALYAELLRA
ncbi:MAG: glycosyltransferase family 4 protein [Proteobacteria bacterium]|nr:glycosyltransferase family 4 protein [Pseudomonadota bacterium]